jgi:hypothetical protein
MAPKTVIDFDLDRYLRASKKLDLSELEWDEISRHELSDGDVMCMQYMMDIETHTVIYLRDLLATRTANDPQVTAFLACWVYEELWHGEAFSDFLRAYGVEVPAEPKLPDGRTPLPTRVRRTRQVREQLGVGHRLSLLPTMLGSMLFPDFIALHMTWGHQRADDPDRLPRADPALRPSGSAPDAAAGDPRRAAPVCLLSDSGAGQAGTRAAPRPAAGALDLRELLDPGRGGRQVAGGGRRARALPLRLRRAGTRDAPRGGRHGGPDPGPRGIDSARRRSRRSA